MQIAEFSKTVYNYMMLQFPIGGIWRQTTSKPLKVAWAQDLLPEGISLQRQELGSGPPQMILEIACKARRISDHRETGQGTIRMSHWCCRTTEGAEFWITCKRLAYLSSFSRLQVIQNKCICDSWIHSCGLEPRQGYCWGSRISVKSGVNRIFLIHQQACLLCWWTCIQTSTS